MYDRIITKSRQLIKKWGNINKIHPHKKYQQLFNLESCRFETILEKPEMSLSLISIFRKLRIYKEKWCLNGMYVLYRSEDINGWKWLKKWLFSYFEELSSGRICSNRVQIFRIILIFDVLSKKKSASKSVTHFRRKVMVLPHIYKLLLHKNVFPFQNIKMTWFKLIKLNFHINNWILLKFVFYIELHSNISSYSK